MEVPQQKVNPDAAYRQPWWSFPISIDRDAAGLHLRVAWGRLSLMLLTLAVTAWLAMVAAIYFWVKYYRGFTDVRIGYIILPHRWPEYSTARGNFYVKQAMAEIREQKWSEAIHHLRVGVAAAPANTEGRLALAQFFSVVGRIELAQRTLLDGLPYERNNTEYLKSLFGFLLQYQEDDEIRRIAAQLLPAAPTIDDRNQLIALAAASAHYYRGEYDQSSALVESYGLLRTKDGRLLLSRIEWERGHRDLALSRLQSYTVEFPTDEEFYNQLAAYHRELGHEAAVEKYALLRELANPRSATARIDLLRTYSRTRNAAQLQRGVDSFLADFTTDRTALLALANLGTETGDAPLARRVYRHLQEHEIETDAAGLMVAEAHIVAREYRAALDFIAELGRTRPEWVKQFLGIVSGLQAVAYYGLDQREDGDRYLGYFLTQPSIRAEHLAAISNRLSAIGAKTQARRVLAQAVTADQRNQFALTRLVELDLAGGPTAELVANLRRLLAMRRPDPALLRDARARLAGDRFLFTSGRDELLNAIDSALALAPVPVPAHAGT